MKLGIPEVVDISTISPHPRNYRNHDADLIHESLVAHGQTRSVVCQVSSRLVLAGNGVYAEMLGLGSKQIVVSWVDVDDEQALKILAMDNRSHDQGWNDDGQLAVLLEDIGKDGWAGSGYDDAAFDDLMAKLHRAEQITVGEEPGEDGQNGTPSLATGVCPTCGQALQ